MSQKLTKDDDALQPDHEITHEMMHVPDHIRPPAEAYRYFPPKEEIILSIGAYTQRLIFDGGLEFEDYEWEYIDQFEQYIKDNEIELTVDLRKLFVDTR
jgi:hypothetical protein